MRRRRRRRRRGWRRMRRRRRRGWGIRRRRRRRCRRWWRHARRRRGGGGRGGSPMSPSSFAAFRTVGPSSSTAARSWHPVSSERVRSDAHNLPFSPLSHFNDRLSASMSWQSLGAPGLTIDGGGGDGAGAAGRFGGGDRAGGGGGLNIWDSSTSTRSRCDASAIGGKSSACRGARGDGVRRGWVAKLGEPHASNSGPRP